MKDQNKQVLQRMKPDPYNWNHLETLYPLSVKAFRKTLVNHNLLDLFANPKIGLESLHVFALTHTIMELLGTGKVKLNLDQPPNSDRRFDWFQSLIRNLESELEKATQLLINSNQSNGDN